MVRRVWFADKMPCPRILNGAEVVTRWWGRVVRSPSPFQGSRRKGFDTRGSASRLHPGLTSYAAPRLAPCRYRGIAPKAEIRRLLSGLLRADHAASRLGLRSIAASRRARAPARASDVAGWEVAWDRSRGTRLTGAGDTRIEERLPLRGPENRGIGSRQAWRLTPRRGRPRVAARGHGMSRPYILNVGSRADPRVSARR